MFEIKATSSANNKSCTKMGRVFVSTRNLTQLNSLPFVRERKKSASVMILLSASGKTWWGAAENMIPNRDGTRTHLCFTPRLRDDRKASYEIRVFRSSYNDLTRLRSLGGQPIFVERCTALLCYPYQIFWPRQQDDMQGWRCPRYLLFICILFQIWHNYCYQSESFNLFKK